MSSHYRWLLFVVVLAVSALWIVLPDTQKPGFLMRPGNPEALEDCLRRQQDDPVVDCSQYEPELDFHQGLDIVGGLRVLLAAELPPDAYTTEDLQEAANNVDRRINALGLAEATIQLQGSTRILVELPGVTDQAQAIDTIQQTALLEFVDFGGFRGADLENLTGRRILTTEQVAIDEQREALQAEQAEEGDSAETVEEDDRLLNPRTGQPFQTVMTGSVLQAARAEFDGSQWMIRFELTSEGAEIFGPFTASRIDEPLAIVLDGEVLSAPFIQSQLTSGGVITGQFTEDEAKTLALQLRSGALPIPLRVESAEQVGATLGQESVERSVRAGIVGVIVVLSFMLFYYRVPGIAADIALIVFILLNVAIFKLIPITLTLPAITGFLISIGTAVDGNILIFERLKEEIRSGRSLDEALNAGFDRAWTSIRDSNISTIIIAGILFLFGQTPGASIVSGFALTLALGLILNLFTAVIVTRTFLYLIVTGIHERVEQRKWLLGV